MDPAKLAEYALSPTHPHGQHKANVFRAVLDLGVDDAESVRTQILEGVSDGTVTSTAPSAFGVRYCVSIPIAGNNGDVADADTVWQLEDDGTVLRFITLRKLTRRVVAADH
jgi:hypothetical protein